MELRDKRDSLSNPGFISYGFGRFGWRNRRGHKKGLSDRKTAGSSKARRVGPVKERKSGRDGLAGWWKPEDNLVG